MRTDVTAVIGKPSKGSSPEGKGLPRVQQLLAELDADLAKRARNNAMLRQLVREAGRELAECARRSQSAADAREGFYWRGGAEPIMPRQIWIMQEKQTGNVCGLLVTELKTEDEPLGSWQAGEILPVAKVSTCDATAMALALQIASEEVGKFSPTAERINLDWMNAGEHGVCPCEERMDSLDYEEWAEYERCIMWPVAGCGDAAYAEGHGVVILGSDQDYGFNVFVRPTIQEKQTSGRLAGKSTGNLSGKDSAEAGDQQTAVERQDTTGEPGRKLQAASLPW